MNNYHYNATIKIIKIDKFYRLIRVYPDDPIKLFSPGQYGSLGLLNEEGKGLIKRPYSISSPIIDIRNKEIKNQKELNYLDFYINYVPKRKDKKEQLTPKLFKLKNNDRIFCGGKIVGHYTLPQTAINNILFISSHSGESPNNSIINQLLLNEKSVNICNIIINQSWESPYKREHKLIAKLYSNYKCILFLDKSKNFNLINCFIKNFLENNIFETQKVGFEFDKENILLFICGDPILIGAPLKKGSWNYIYPDYGLINILKAFSLEVKTRFKKGQILYESYW